MSLFVSLIFLQALGLTVFPIPLRLRRRALTWQLNFVYIYLCASRLYREDFGRATSGLCLSKYRLQCATSLALEHWHRSKLWVWHLAIDRSKNCGFRSLAEGGVESRRLVQYRYSYRDHTEEDSTARRDPLIWNLRWRWWRGVFVTKSKHV